MFGAGWTEMLIIGVVALVVIGPKDLPIVMRRVGRIVGTVRRMGSEFQRELNKTTGLDQIADLRRSITEPLTQTRDEIVREFNRQTATGVEPSGVLKPADPAVESVYDQIAATSGVAAGEAAAKAPPPVMKPMASMPEPSPAPAEASAPVVADKPKARRTAKPKPVALVATAPVDVTPAPKRAARPRAKAVVPVAAEPTPTVVAAAPKRAAKPKAETAIPLAEAPPAVGKTAARTRAKPATAGAASVGSVAGSAPEATPSAKPARRRTAKA